MFHKLNIYVMYMYIHICSICMYVLDKVKNNFFIKKKKTNSAI